jgi:hypothetical protein
MTKRWWLSGVALVAGAVLLTAVACTAAPDKDDPKKAGDEPAAKETPAGEGIASVLLAYKLADYGRGVKSPLALATAADILGKFRVPEVDPKADAAAGDDEKFKGYKAEPGEGSTAVKADPRTFFRDEAVKLLDEADKMLEEDRNLAPADFKVVQSELALVRKGLPDPKKRGAAAGPLVYRMKVKPGQTDTYNVKFNKNEWARMAIRNETGGPDSRLVLAAVNPGGHTRTDDGGHDPAIAFIPHASDSADFKITVTNKGKTEVIYQLFIN